MKAVMLSIKPKYCELIASGKKTIEVRKTKPKLKTPFKCYIYCTLPKERFSIGQYNYTCRDNLYLYDNKVNYGDGFEDVGNEIISLNGKVIGEFVCDAIIVDKTFGHDDLFNAAACLSVAEVAAYCINKEIYGWHISDLVIYDKPKELNEFYTYCSEYERIYITAKCEKCKYYRVNDVDKCAECTCHGFKPITRPPQSWCYVEEV